MTTHLLCDSIADTVNAIGNVFGQGFTGAEIPVGSSVYPSLSLPGDAAKNYWVQVQTLPASGQLFVWEDGSFDFVADVSGIETFSVNLWEDGTLLGVVDVEISATADIALGGTPQAGAQAGAGLLLRVSVDASVLAAATALGGLSVVIPISGEVRAAADAVGGLTIDLGAAGELHGDAFAQAVVSGQVTTVNLLPALAGSGSASTQVMGSLTAPEWIDLAGNVSASGQGDAEMSGGSPFTSGRQVDLLFRAQSAARKPAIAFHAEGRTPLFVAKD